jgi:hypothetical protein
MQYEIPASTVHAVKGFLMSGPYKALGVTVKQEFGTWGQEPVLSLFFFVQNLSSLVMEPGLNDARTLEAKTTCENWSASQNVRVVLKVPLYTCKLEFCA